MKIPKILSCVVALLISSVVPAENYQEVQEKRLNDHNNGLRKQNAERQITTVGKEQFSTLSLPFESGSFTIAVLPDTQYYVGHWRDVPRDKHLHHFLRQTEWIAENASTRSIAYVVHLGDITQDNIPEEWENAKKAFATLDRAGIPYALNYGNHDYYRRIGDDRNRPCLGNEYFKTTDFEKWPTFGGIMEDGKMDNNYHLFEANGIKFMIISLRWAPPDEAVLWADEILAKYPDRKAIFVTHAYLYYDNTRYDRHGRHGKQRWCPSRNDGEELWQKLLRKHKNVFLVLSGHVLGNGLGQLTSVGDHGNEVHQILVNYQMLPEGGSGFMRLIEFLPDGRTIQFKSYSPSLNEYKTDEQNQFTLKAVL